VNDDVQMTEKESSPGFF